MTQLPHRIVCLLLACGLTVAAAAATTTVQLHSEATCPDADALAAFNVSAVRQMFGATNGRVCAVECAAWPQCAVARHVADNLTCQLASQAAWLQLWHNSSSSSSSSCVSLTRPPRPPAELLSKLLALYNFRFGLDNLVTSLLAAVPGALPRFNATPTAVFVPRQGYRLNGDVDSYLEVDLGAQPLSARLGAAGARRATFFVKVTSTLPTMPFSLHSLYNRSLLSYASSYSGKWSRDNSGVVSFAAGDLSDLAYSTSSSVITSGAGIAYSTAVAFNSTGGAGGAKFYYNGAWQVAATPTTADPATVTRGDEILRIGYDVSFTLNGLVHCYAVASESLTLEELRQLDEVC